MTERGLLCTADSESEPRFTVNAFTVGCSRDLSHSEKWETALGGMVLYHNELDPLGGRRFVDVTAASL